MCRVSCVVSHVSCVHVSCVACRVSCVMQGVMQGVGAGRDAVEAVRGVIGRLSVLLLDGFKEEEEANPAASRRGRHASKCTACMYFCLQRCQ